MTACTYKTAESWSTDSGIADTGGADTNDGGDDDFVTVSASTFDMGSTPGQPELGYGVHSVTLTHDYLVAVTEVTHGQFEAAMGYNPSTYTECDGDGSSNCPVENADWHESAAYANALSAAAGLTDCYTCTGSGAEVECEVAGNPYECEGYRLLTEAEWEGAARCGSDTWYAGSDVAGVVAWGQWNTGSLHEVAGLQPNDCGIYDMSGNVWEWTHDWYADYPSESVTDPTGPETGSERVLRGGGVNMGGFESATVSYRSWGAPGSASRFWGFRVGRTSL